MERLALKWPDMADQIWSERWTMAVLFLRVPFFFRYLYGTWSNYRFIRGWDQRIKQTINVILKLCFFFFFCRTISLLLLSILQNFLWVSSQMLIELDLVFFFGSIPSWPQRVKASYATEIKEPECIAAVSLSRIKKLAHVSNKWSLQAFLSPPKTKNERNFLSDFCF